MVDEGELSGRRVVEVDELRVVGRLDGLAHRLAEHLAALRRHRGGLNHRDKDVKSDN